ncbi:hypothetical protein UFOVP1519_36 [uncultured Caudovirales phage]|uniref:Uncharacterized protein n=1 Tax=uncultured Caudovirales phage TaxID=2100421 RepID=A0A6J5S943_9CAUD|nr:hypothetical protein UFOVP1306_28 [uncultured Caudovirales phage]CAB4210256.1 hypothetical protein UFOVP1422_30 [uncultured Caudovirales phage]CAB5227366.1 hypothetical protein UFOVP1519_36 [uncultured Caudovirales phage]
MAAEQLFQVFNGVAPTTAAPVAQPTGTAIRTMLQIAVPSTNSFYIVEWGISFDGIAVTLPIKCELLTTTVAATMTTALSASDVVLLTETAGSASTTTYGTGLTAFSSAAVTEGTPANVRELDVQLVAPTNQYIKQWPLGREPVVPASSFIRVRVTANTSVNAYCYVVWGE